MVTDIPIWEIAFAPEMVCCISWAKGVPYFSQLYNQGPLDGKCTIALVVHPAAICMSKLGILAALATFWIHSSCTMVFIGWTVCTGIENFYSSSAAANNHIGDVQELIGLLSVPACAVSAMSLAPAKIR